MTLQKNFCNFISAIWDISNVSLTEFSEELQISRTLLQDILRGTANPRMDTIEHISKRLDIDPIHLLTCSYSKEQIHVALPLLCVTHAVSNLTEDKMQTFLDLINEIIILFQNNEK